MGNQKLICEQRNLPARGFRPGVMLFAVAGLMTFGFWKVGKGIREQKYVFSPILSRSCRRSSILLENVTGAGASACGLKGLKVDSMADAWHTVSLRAKRCGREYI